VASFTSVETIYAWGVCFLVTPRSLQTLKAYRIHYLFALNVYSLRSKTSTTFYGASLSNRLSPSSKIQTNSQNTCDEVGCLMWPTASITVGAILPDVNRNNYLFTPKVKRQDPKITLIQAQPRQFSVNALDTDNPGWTWFSSVSPGNCGNRTLKLGDECFLPHSFQVIHYNPITQRDIAQFLIPSLHKLHIHY